MCSCILARGSAYPATVKPGTVHSTLRQEMDDRGHVEELHPQRLLAHVEHLKASNCRFGHRDLRTAARDLRAAAPS